MSILEKLLELSNVVYDIKDKLTDGEYKKIMDTLGNINEVKNNEEGNEDIPVFGSNANNAEEVVINNLNEELYDMENFCDNLRDNLDYEIWEDFEDIITDRIDLHKLGYYRLQEIVDDEKLQSKIDNIKNNIPEENTAYYTRELIAHIKCGECGVVLEPHSTIEHFDIENKVHSCEEKHKRESKEYNCSNCNKLIDGEFVCLTDIPDDEDGYKHYNCFFCLDCCDDNNYPMGW